MQAANQKQLLINQELVSKRHADLRQKRACLGRDTSCRLRSAASQTSIRHCVIRPCIRMPKKADKTGHARGPLGQADGTLTKYAGRLAEATAAGEPLHGLLDRTREVRDPRGPVAPGP